jgi:hypothetical protein
MTPEERAKAVARGLVGEDGTQFDMWTDIAEAILAAITEERKACAEVADGHKPASDPIGPLHFAGRAHAAENIAAAIRARG